MYYMKGTLGKKYSAYLLGMRKKYESFKGYLFMRFKQTQGRVKWIPQVST